MPFIRVVVVSKHGLEVWGRPNRLLVDSGISSIRGHVVIVVVVESQVPVRHCLDVA